MGKAAPGPSRGAVPDEDRHLIHKEDTVMEKKFLIAVDLQKDFIDGSLGTPEARAIVSAAARRIRYCRENGWTVLATLDTHGPDYMDTPEGKKLPVPHCVRGTEGWALNPEIQSALSGCPAVEKPTFGSVRLPGIIRALTEDDSPLAIELIGLCTDICVVSNALLLKAHFPDASIRVNAACCAGVTPEKHEAALEVMRSCQIDVINA